MQSTRTKREHQENYEVLEDSGPKRRAVSLETRIEILKLLDAGLSQYKVASALNICRKSVRHTNDNRDKYLMAREDNVSEEMSRIKEDSPVNILTYRWYCIARKRGEKVTDSDLRNQALKFHSELCSKSTFSASNGWILRFKKKRNIQVSGADDEAMNSSHEQASCFRCENLDEEKSNNYLQDVNEHKAQLSNLNELPRHSEVEDDTKTDIYEIS